MKGNTQDISAVLEGFGELVSILFYPLQNPNIVALFCVGFYDETKRYSKSLTRYGVEGRLGEKEVKTLINRGLLEEEGGLLKLSGLGLMSTKFMVNIKNGIVKNDSEFRKNLTEEGYHRLIETYTKAGLL
jgi:hypothetical protein